MPVVREVLPSWRTGLVVEVPSSVATLHEALASDPGTYTGIAAVTTTTDGSLAPDAPVHVFVNPVIFGQLRPTGSQVVMSHEAVHVATEAATNNTMPLWLLEGFADYVALLDVDLPVSTTAGQIIDRVRDGRSAGDACRDRPSSTRPPPTSGRRTSRRGSPAGCWPIAEARPRWFVSTCRSATAPRIGSALRREFGLTEAELTQLWQDLLTDLAA